MSKHTTFAPNIKICRKETEKIGIGIIYLFGSHAEGVSNSRSDIDVGIVFRNPDMIKENTFKVYNKIYQMFCNILPGYEQNLDIVFLERAPLELQFDVVKHGKILYEVSVDFRLNYEEHITLLYADFYPILQETNQAILDRT